jgi:hypothetical protein
VPAGAFQQLPFITASLLLIKPALAWISTSILRGAPMIAFDMTGRSQEVEQILALARERPDLAQASEPAALDASRALNVGLPDVGPTEILTFLTLLFSTGKAALEFFKLVRDQLNQRGTRVAVADAPTGKLIGQIEATTTDHSLKALAGQ